MTEPCLDITSGIKNADPEELKRVASQPSSDFFFFVNDFSILRTLLPLISRRVCTTAGGVPVTLPRKFLPILSTLAQGSHSNPSLGVLTYVLLTPTLFPAPLILPPTPFTADDTPSGPRDLVLSEPSSQSLRVQWTAASGPVTGYKVQYTPLTGLGQPLPSERQEVRMSVSSDWWLLRTWLDYVR